MLLVKGIKRLTLQKGYFDLVLYLDRLNFYSYNVKFFKHDKNQAFNFF
jgi:hypothetical protein